MVRGCWDHFLVVTRFLLVGCFCLLPCLSHGLDWKEAEPPKRISVLVGNDSLDGIKVKKIKWEKYLAGVLSAEITCRVPQEALKAQAVLARTFALYRFHKSRVSGRGYDIRAGTMDQAMDMARPSSACLKPIQQTRGKVLAIGSLLIEALYHSSCGGNTARPEDVYSRASPGFDAVYCGWCVRSNERLWRYAISRKDLARDFAEIGGLPGIKGLYSLKSNAKGRVLNLGLLSSTGSLDISAVRLRSILGERKLRSTVFEIENLSSHIVFSGQGYGHGVGLCQEGMLAMARAGWGWKRIIKYYYPNSVIRTARRKKGRGLFVRKKTLWGAIK